MSLSRRNLFNKATELFQQKEEKVERYPGILGITDTGPVKVPDRDSFVYCRLSEIECIPVYNQRVPVIAGLKVWLGYSKDRPNVFQVLDIRDDAAFSPINSVVPHAETHTFPEKDTVWIKGEQYLPGLITPYSGTVVSVYSLPVWDGGEWSIPQVKQLDLSSYMPQSGSVWAMIEYGTTGTIRVRTSSWVPTKQSLLTNLIPAPSGTTIGAIALYGQGVITKSKYTSDIVDLRTNSPRSGGSIVLPSNKVIATNGAAIDTSGPDWNATDKMIIITKDEAFINPYATQPGLMAIGESTKPGALVAIGATSGTAGPTFFGSRGDGSLASPTNTKTNMRLSSFGGGGYDGTSWGGTQAVMRILADENWTPTARGSHIEFWETPTGSNALTKRCNLMDLAPLASPAMTGIPTVPTAAQGTNTTQVASTAFVQGEKLVPETNQYPIFRCDSPGGVSAFSSTIATLPGGANLTYNTGTGQEGAMKPYATTNLAKMVLYNTTRNSSALILDCNTTTNTLTLTANVPADWQVGDTITIASQTVTGAPINYVDLKITSGPTGKSALLLELNIISATPGDNMRVHPFEAYGQSKQQTAQALVANLNGMQTKLLKITNDTFSLGWTGTPGNIIISETGS